jgi:hypothetical protein
MAYAHWRIFRSGDDLRVRVESDDQMNDADVEALWDDIRNHLEDDGVTAVLFEIEGTWVAMHRHRGKRWTPWHLRTAAGSPMPSMTRPQPHA